MADEDVCNSICVNELKCCRTNRESAIAVVFKAYTFGFEANAAELTRLDKARREASTTCEGLFEGQRFESIAGKAKALFKKGRNEGPPLNIC